MEEVEERETLVFTSSSSEAVEYLEPLVGRELLSKFPDNSAFDFDYSQSSIWSPLLPRTHTPIDLGLITPTKKLSFEMKRNTLRILTSNIKKKITATAFKFNLNLIINTNKKKKRMKKNMGSDFSPNPPPTNIKGWTKVLRAASKHFKKKKKKDMMVHGKLSTCI